MASFKDGFSRIKSVTAIFHFRYNLSIEGLDDTDMNDDRKYFMKI